MLTAAIALLPEYCPGHSPAVAVESFGRVVDERTGEPIAGAKVVLELGLESVVAYADSEGLWVVPLEPGTRSGVGRVRVTASGFRIYDRQISLAGGGRIEEIRLAPVDREPVGPLQTPPAPEPRPIRDPPGGGGPGLDEPIELPLDKSVVIPAIDTTITFRLEPVGWRGDTVPRMTIAPAAGRVVTGDLIAGTGRLGFEADGRRFVVDVVRAASGGVILTVRSER